MPHQNNLILIAGTFSPELNDLIELLPKAGYRILTAGNIHAAFKLAEGEEPDLLICLPGSASVESELADLLSQGQNPNFVPVLIFSEKRPSFLRAELDDFIAPPFEPFEFIAKIARLIERKRLNDKFREAETRFNALLENASDILSVMSPEGIILYESPALRHILGYQSEELCGKNAFEFIHPDDQAHTLETFIKAFQTATAQWSSEYRFRHKDGSWAWLKSSANRFFDPAWGAVCIVVSRDVTDRKQAQLARRQSENRFGAIFYNTSIGIAIGDQQLRPVESNAAYQKMLGYDAEELRQMTIQEFTHPDDVERDVRLHKDLLAGKRENFQVEKRYIRKDGQVIWGNLTVSMVRNDSGAPLFSVAMVEDITERKRTEEELRQSEASFRAIIDNTPHVAIEGYDRDGRVRFWNAAAEHIFGFSEEDALGKTLDQLILSPEQNADFLEMLREMEENGRAVGPAEWEFTGKGDRKGVLYSTTFPIYAGGEKIFVCMDVDITERKRIEESLRESEQRYRDLIENADDIIYTHDLCGNYSSINKAGERLTGYRSDEVLKMKIQDVVAPDHLETAMARFREKLEGVPQAAYEIDIITKDGQRLPLEVNTRLIYERGEPAGVQGIARDITARKNLEEQLRQSQKLEAVGRLAGGIAHDFNNMLTVITSYSEMLLHQLDAGNPARSRVEEIKRAGERSAMLTQQLLAFSRRQILQLQVIDLNRAVADMSQMLERLIGEDIQLIVRLSPELGFVKADAGQITQVVMNLAVNARDAMPQGGRLVIETQNVYLGETSLQSVPGESGHYVLLRVSDSGTGMDAETQEHIFEPFFTTKDVGKGTGLGLSTVYGVVKQSGGFLEVRSEVGKGTTFEIYLPQIEEKLSEIEPAKHNPESGIGTILLVEDEKMVRDLAREILEMYGFKVFEAANGVQALELYKRQKPKIDLLMTDVVMPQMSGRELAENLNALNSEIAVLYTSGYTDVAIGNHGVLDNDTNFIQKPFSPETLIRKIINVLGER